MLAEQRLRSRTDTKPFGQLFIAAHRDPCALGSKTDDMILFLLKKAFGDQHRHIYVFMSGFFKAGIEDFLDIFPDRVTIGTEYNTATHARIFAKLGFYNNVGIPFGKIDIHGGDGFDHLLLLCHEGIFLSLLRTFRSISFGAFPSASRVHPDS